MINHFLQVYATKCNCIPFDNCTHEYFKSILRYCASLLKPQIWISAAVASWCQRLSRTGQSCSMLILTRPDLKMLAALLSHRTMKAGRRRRRMQYHAAVES